MPFVQDQIKQLGAGVLPAFAIAALPKCPLCWMALLSSLGLGSIINVEWLRPLTVFFLAVALGAIAIRSRQIDTYGPLILGVAAAIAIYIFKFVFNIDTGVYLSGAFLIGATLWNSVLKSKQVRAGCSCHETDIDKEEFNPINL